MSEVEVERRILRQFAVDLKNDVIPSDLLPYLCTCLTDDDCEQILREEDRKGPRAAVQTLLDKLKKRLHQGAFKEFLKALEENGCSHLKEKLQNALDQAHQPKPEPYTPTQDTTSNALKTPTTETANSVSRSTPDNKQSRKTTSSTKSDKKLKLKNGPVPKENTTSPPGSKTNVKVKTEDPSDSQPVDTTDANPSYVKLVKATKSTKSKKTGASQKVPPVTKKNGNSKKETSSNNDVDTQQPPAPTEQVKYDTLVCYATENRQIAQELKEFLETECNLQVCIDFEHFIPGKTTADNISESITSSGSVIFLLSPKFLKKLWAPWELSHAVYNCIESKKDGKHKKIIPVLLKECQVPNELKIYTAIKMDESGSRKDCWKKIAAAILGTSCSDDDSDHGCNGDEEDNDEDDDNGGDDNGGDNSDGEENDSEENNGDDGGNNEGTIGDSNNHKSDDSVDSNVDNNNVEQGGEDTVDSSNEAESNDDESSDDDGDGSENSSHESDNGDNHNCDNAAANNSNDTDVSDDVDCNGDGCDGDNTEVDSISNNVVVDGNASGDNSGAGNGGAGNGGAGNGGVNNVGDKSKDVYGKIDSL